MAYLKLASAASFAEKARSVAENYRTVYMKGTIGSPLTAELLKNRAAQYPDWYTAARKKTLESYCGCGNGKKYFGFDCVCLIKSLLWGWNGNEKLPHGGAVYESGSVPDVTVAGLVALCDKASSDFGSILPGELLYMDGHVGLYIGNGLGVECTTAWNGGVQISAVGNQVGTAGRGYPIRKWKGHCRLPWLDYAEKQAENKSAPLPILQKGAKGSAVSVLQGLLTLWGYPPGKCGMDGSFGADTHAALLAFQNAMGLCPNGICDSDCWAAFLGGKEGKA